MGVREAAGPSWDVVLFCRFSAASETFLRWGPRRRLLPPEGAGEACRMSERRGGRPGFIGSVVRNEARG